MKRREDKRMVKLDLFIFKNAFFGHIFKKETYSLFGAWPSLLVHIPFTPSEGPKDFVNRFFYKKMEVGPWKRAIFHGSNFMVHGVNRPSRGVTTIIKM